MQVSAANVGETGDLALVIKGQNNGPVYVGSNVDAANSALAFELRADTSTGVVANTLVFVENTGYAVFSTVGQRPIAGVALNTATSGNAVVAYAGRVVCDFDTTGVATTPGDYVTPSTTKSGKCHDYGASLPTTGQVLGTLLDTVGTVLLRIGN